MLGGGGRGRRTAVSQSPPGLDNLGPMSRLAIDDRDGRGGDLNPRHRAHVVNRCDMRVLITGSSGHLGEALVDALSAAGADVVGLDAVASTHTSIVGSITDRRVVRASLEGVDAVVHTAALHKPQVGTHTWQEFVNTNVSGTLNLLEEAADARVGSFVYTSTTSTFGRALNPPPGEPAAWITEDVAAIPHNIYGATKTAGEDLCELLARDRGLPCITLRTSRFFPEADDRDDIRDGYADLNVKVNELLYRRVDLDDVVTAHRLAIDRAPELGFGRYIISATTPFHPEDLAGLHEDAPRVLRRLFPAYEQVYQPLGWTMFPTLERVYVNARARRELGWSPHYDFSYALDRLAAGEDPRSPRAAAAA